MSAGRPENPAERDANRGGFATGPELHARLARDGAPEERTVRGLKPTRQPRLKVKDALAATSVSGSDPT